MVDDGGLSSVRRWLPTGPAGWSTWVALGWRGADIWVAHPSPGTDAVGRIEVVGGFSRSLGEETATATITLKSKLSAPISLSVLPRGRDKQTATLYPGVAQRFDWELSAVPRELGGTGQHIGELRVLENATEKLLQRIPLQR